MRERERDTVHTICIAEILIAIVIVDSQLFFLYALPLRAYSIVLASKSTNDGNLL